MFEKMAMWASPVLFVLSVCASFLTHTAPDRQPDRGDAQVPPVTKIGQLNEYKVSPYTAATLDGVPRPLRGMPKGAVITNVVVERKWVVRIDFASKEE